MDIPEFTLYEALEWAISRLTDFDLDEPEDTPKVAAALRALARTRGEEGPMTETPRQIAERIARKYRQAPNLADLIENAILKFVSTEKLAAAYAAREHQQSRI